MQQEATMLPQIDQGPIALAARSIHRIHDGSGLLIECLSGALWITQHGDHRDVILERGQSFRLDRDGLAVVYALEAGRFRVESAHRRPSSKATAAKRAA